LRLKDESTKLKARLAVSQSTAEELSGFKTLAISQLAAQHDEIQRLRRSQAKPVTVRNLRPAGSGVMTGPR